MQGNAKAYDAAKNLVKTNLQAQGKTAGDQDIINATLKTLGQANKEIKQAAWDKKVDDTSGGKIATDILSKTPEPIEDYSI